MRIEPTELKRVKNQDSSETLFIRNKTKLSLLVSYTKLGIEIEQAWLSKEEWDDMQKTAIKGE